MMASVGYDAKHAILEIAFSAGAVYEYFMVPKAVFQSLLEARSKGHFFRTHIEGTYRFVQRTGGRRP